MSGTYWFERWHGAKLPAAEVSALSTGGGSTSMSTGVTLALSTKSGVGHPHVIDDVTNLASSLAAISSTLAGKAATAHSHYKSDVTDFAHTHGSTDVAGLDSTLANLSTSIAANAALVHTHGTTNVTGLDGTLSGISSSLSGLSSGLSSKADVIHTHGTTNITGLDSTIAGLSTSLAMRSLSTHIHAVVTSDTTGFCPKRPVDSTTWLRSDGTWVAPPTGGAGGGIPSTWCSASTHTLTGSTTMQTATGLAFAVSSAALYRFEFIVGWQSIAITTGIAFGVNGPASPTMLVYETDISTGLIGGVVTRTGRAFNVQTVASLAIDSSGVNSYAYVGGVLRNGVNAGTLQLQFASEVAGSTVSVRGGSVGLLFGPL